MRRGTQLCVACILLLVYQCAGQGGGGASKAKSTYAHPRDFSQWDRGLHQDPLVLVAFIMAIISGVTSCQHASSVLSQITLTTYVVGLSVLVWAIPKASLLLSAVPGFLLIMWSLVTTSTQQPSTSSYAARDL